jgi:hypothetical protein
MLDRDPYDGEPYYCSVCGAGLAELIACEEVECALETKAAAEARQRRRRPMTTAKPLGEQA